MSIRFATSSPIRTSRSPGAFDKKLALSKFKEPSDDEFELDEDQDLDLSYSRFSRISGTSKNTSSLDTSELSYKQHSLQNIPLNSRNKLHYRDTSSTKSSIYPIKEISMENEENTPFLSTPKHKQRSTSVKVSLTPAQRMEKRPGIRSKNALENFQFGDMVGRGAFATVYKGLNLKTNHVVAIKQILLEKDQDVQALMGEIDLLKILRHPNIVKYHGFVKTSNSLNVFLEFCAGGSLRQLYKRLNSGLPEPQIIAYVKSILHGLNYLHEQGVVHRDVKAANVLITDTGDIKLADFGVATKVTSEHQSVVGTPNWMAPETVLGGEGLCTASDVWSLGATIIELFTTNPPYHDLNPMATLHAIGTDDHPPLPKNISSVAKDFLMECFQKQPSLRVSAKLLLKHKWLHNTNDSFSKSHKLCKIDTVSNSNLNVKSITSYSENLEENWENDFTEMKITVPQLNLASDVLNLEAVKTPTEEFFVTPPSKNEVLNKFCETNNDSVIDNDLEKLNLNRNNLSIFNRNDRYNNDEDDDDPFLDIEIDNFDTNELEIQSKMEFLITKFSTRVDLCQSGNEDIAHSLVKIMGKISHLVKKYPSSHDTLIRDHGILSIFELLENINDMPDLPKLWYYSLTTLNYIFESSISQFENFCLLGGIPVVTQFRGNNYDIAIKLQVNRFIRLTLKSDKALSMFISSGGLRVLSKLAEEDIETNPHFPITSIDCLHAILNNNLLSSKSDLCRKLSHYGVIFWFIVLLNRLVKLDSPNQYSTTVDKIIQILKFFGQSEVKVRINISSGDLFKLLFKIYPHLETNHKLTVLKFIKSMSYVSEILKHFQSAEMLEFLVILIKEHTPSTDRYKEYINIICPIIYNYCYLNHVRETELIKLGALPYLKELSKINLPFRQFVLPIMCELVYCEKYVQNSLVKYNILDVYLNLLLDPYWQANSLDSILNWYKKDPDHVVLTSSKATTCLTTGFSLNKISNLESALDNFLKLVNLNSSICHMFVNEEILQSIFSKLSINLKNSVVQLSLLRILKVLVSNSAGVTLSFDNIRQVLQSLESRKNSLLVDELAHEIISII
ncbi:hypothetical protein CANTEDRAFT_97999 [Yamadazyma tenuis ATCC 10573]|uniref:Protein kinase domain-containing protein n=1 Tax=Candida tenuis (strain ATCC 10573 / BCRC 21748 / CBS 615 / JCM 9827 / NBRC 10315 / NRRL Y-1498 / VKM Y-70) TaxID=590646 RepID=G3B4P4_CANTC|nr:uncharacterized protein CANTEDRAFT_97999 [Yamadazyma tenuis ATCC 10573]EGV63996.1 hypothetical protein CANTEDRAFT_97999 [Yamadazyma tenuis ATCC 10573]